MSENGFNIVIPTYNSEKSIGECLSQINDPNVEIYVIDSYSTDKTESIVNSYHNINFIKFKWNKMFPKKRNWVLMNVDLKYDWVLFLDSDEFINQKIIDEIKNKIYRTSSRGFWICYENYFNNKILKYGIQQKKLALFNKNFGLYEKIEIKHDTNLDMEIHEHPIIKGKVGELKNRIRHQDIRSIENLLHKHIDYAVWEKHRFNSINSWNDFSFRQKFKYKLMSSLLFPYIYFVLNYFVFLGFLDGKNGLHHSLFKFNYFLNIYLLLKEFKK